MEQSRVRTCLTCGVEFVGKGVDFCSLRCAGKRNRAGYAQKRREGPEPGPIKNARWIPLGGGLFVLGRKIQTDHINRNTLDCRRENLRPVTTSQNNMNARKQSHRSSKYKGVCFNKSRQRWIMTIGKDGREIGRARFDSEEEAARAYDEAARRHFGEFARLNFPRPGEQSALEER